MVGTVRWALTWRVLPAAPASIGDVALTCSVDVAAGLPSFARLLTCRDEVSSRFDTCSRCLTTRRGKCRISSSMHETHETCDRVIYDPTYRMPCLFAVKLFTAAKSINRCTRSTVNESVGGFSTQKPDVIF